MLRLTDTIPAVVDTQKIAASPMVAEARRRFEEQLNSKPWAKRVREIVNEAPDLSPQQIDRIEVIVSGSHSPLRSET